MLMMVVKIWRQVPGDAGFGVICDVIDTIELYGDRLKILCS